MERTPFTVGRKVDKDLVIADPRVSRDHAQILKEGQEFFLIDLGSKHGTFVNGERVQRQKLERGDRLEFGARDSAYLLFNPGQEKSNTAREFLSQISVIQIKPEATDLEKLKIFLEAARKLNTVGVLDEILMTMLDTTLQLTNAERGYVFLKDEDGKLRLRAGRNSKKEPLLDDKTISHSILEDSLRSNSRFLLTDTSQSLDLAGRQSIVAYDLRTVICIPLRKMQVQATRDVQTPAPTSNSAEAMGALYIDSRFASRDISGVDEDILDVIATEAASLIENARLVQAEEEARRYQQELSIAASIQQRLMQVKIPEVPFASLRGKNLSCKEIGGDFYDAVNTKEGLAVVLAERQRQGSFGGAAGLDLTGDDLFAVGRRDDSAGSGDCGEPVLYREDGRRKICDCAAGASAARWRTRIRQLRPCAAAPGLWGRSAASAARKCSRGTVAGRDFRERPMSDEVRRPLHSGD